MWEGPSNEAGRGRGGAVEAAREQARGYGGYGGCYGAYGAHPARQRAEELLPPRKHVERVRARAPPLDGVGEGVGLGGVHLSQAEPATPAGVAAEEAEAAEEADDDETAEEAAESTSLLGSGHAAGRRKAAAADVAPTSVDAPIAPPVLPAPTVQWGRPSAYIGDRVGAALFGRDQVANEKAPLGAAGGGSAGVAALTRSLHDVCQVLDLREAELWELKDQARRDRNENDRLRARLGQELARRSESMMDTALAASTQAITMLHEEQALIATLAAQKAAAEEERIIELPPAAAPSKVEALHERKAALQRELAAVERRLETLAAPPTGVEMPR